MPQDPVEDPIERREEMDHAVQFPFLRLPNELISKTLSYASWNDRMAVRGVCKRLHAIEAETKCYIEKLRICDRLEWNRDVRSVIDGRSGTQYIFWDASFSRDFMRFLDRVSNNTSVGTLCIDISLRLFIRRQIESDIYKTIKKFDAKNVHLFGVSSTGVHLWGFLLNMARKCHDIFSDITVLITELHDVYKGMADGSMKLRRLTLTNFNFSSSDSLLDRIGIRVEAGQFFSNKDIEVYKNKRTQMYCIFDEDLFIDRRGKLFIIIRHETPESLEEAKNAVRKEEEVERVDVVSLEE